MKKSVMLICSLLLAAAVAHGEQVVKKDAFWDKLSQKLEKITPAKKGSTTTAVGGVRGAKNEDAADIYWKGKEKSVDMAQDELQKFNTAVESKMKGDNEQALKQFEEFLVLYPQSAFRVEGLQAVEKIKQEIAAAKSPAVKEAPVEAPAASSDSSPAPVAPAAAPAAPPAVEAVPEPVK
jgi:hypothetical protein